MNEVLSKSGTKVRRISERAKDITGYSVFFRVFLDTVVYRVSVKRRLKPKSWVMVG